MPHPSTAPIRRRRAGAHTGKGALRSLAKPAMSDKGAHYDFLIKLLLIGDSGVGKSCLLLRFAVRAACVFAKNWLRPGALCCLLGLTRAFSGGAGR